MIYCSHCGKHVPQDSVFCPECGKSVNGKDGKQHKTTLTIKRTHLFIGTGALIIFIVLYYVSSALYLFNKKEPFTRQEVIEYKERIEEDDALLSSISYYRQFGENGVREVKSERIYDSAGKVIKTRKLSEIITQEPKEQIKVQGKASFESVRGRVQSTVQSYCSAWKDSKWNEIIKLSSNTTGYSDSDLSFAAKEVSYQVSECSVRDINAINVTNTAYGSLGGMEFPMAVRVPITLKTTSIYTPSEESFSYILEGKYDSSVKQWRFVFPGPVKITSINQTKAFGPGRGSKELGGSVTLERMIFWNNTVYFVAFGSFLDGTPIRNISFRGVKDDLGQGYSPTFGEGGQTLSVGSDKAIKVWAGFKSDYLRKDIIQSMTVVIYRVTSQTSGDSSIPTGPVYWLPAESQLTFDSLKF